MNIRAALVFLLLCAPVASAGELPPDPENTLYMDLADGRVVIRMRPDLAPNHVARIKHLVRGGYYDGMAFHRVIDGFVAQTGDPSGKGNSGSGRSLKAEFSRIAQDRGTVSMARAGGRDSADSQWFIVLSGSHRKELDGKYTAWGEVTSGMEFVDKIRKGNANSGAVSNPDHLVRLQVAADADPPAETVAASELLKRPEAAAVARDFSGVEFRCVALDRGAGVQPALARLWAHGYLAGSYRAQGKLSLAATSDNAVDEFCKAHAEAFLFPTLGQELKAPRDLPGATAAFAPASYACKEYVAARNANTPEADFVDLWAASFIQGFKNVGQPDLEIPFDAKARILTALKNACAANPEFGFLDLTAAVAEKVTLK